MLHYCASLATAALIAIAPVAHAEPLRATDNLLDMLGLQETVAVMRREGMDYGNELAEEMLPGGAGASWSRMVAQIYDTTRMEDVVRDGFAAAWEQEGRELGEVTAFFASTAGAEIVRLEVSARDAMTDPDVEDAARAAYRDRSDQDDDPRLAMIDQFIDNNDLIDANVVGAMNSSYEFYAGLVDGGAFEMSEEEILGVVWESEAESRADTREWLFAYMMMAYQPLDDAALGDYVAISASDAGKALNRALFAGFDQMYTEISYALGLALAHQMTAQEL
ncbi:hypothetical protein Q4577_05370 [Marinovum sp. 2_MG-2023]|uniref:hypothetical protein n=1 Tax=unclassified Marinovum TaxID=2647166 RepID=UPI0026E273C4|nr:MULTISPECIES: hypothetical protein [unclassified Marinovum]MDO6729440.1 hypothetical protein [Marinovum sp. 2_MG-2023]MDO6781324.1 hypothetical protein [Marinovum sp. 1_MG-2023]